MEITKNTLINLISENYISDLEELEKKVKKSDEGVRKRRPIFDKTDELQIGWEFRQDMEDLNSPLVPVLFICGDDIENFKSQHPEVIQKLQEKYGEWYFSQEACPKHRPEAKQNRVFNKASTGQPENPFAKLGWEGGDNYLVYADGKIVAQHKDENSARVLGDEYLRDHPGAKIEVKIGKRTQLAQESIKREFNTLIKNELMLDSGFTKALSMRSIPPIMSDNPKYLDRHVDKWTNEKLVFRALSYNTYGSGKDFLTAVVKRTKGVTDLATNTDYLARQFNKKYRNWEEERKSDVKYKGKTDDPDYEPPYERESSYKLNIQGYEQLNMDVSLKMVFEILGEKIGNGYVWTIKMVNKFGRKRPEDQYIQGGLKPLELLENGVLDGAAIIATKTVQLPPNVEFDNKNTIIHNEDILQGLKSTIEEFKTKINQIQPKDLIKVANIKRTDVERVNENEINTMIKRTLLEMKK